MDIRKFPVHSIFIVSLLSMFILSGCQSFNSELGLANVTKIELVTLESFPVQIQIDAKGFLSNTCTEIIRPIVQKREENKFLIVIKTKSFQGFCIQLLAPFAEMIPLDVYGLPAGTYIVDVNGIKGTFTLDVDNILTPEDKII